MKRSKYAAKLYGDVHLNVALNGGKIDALRSAYPENDWGITLMHYDMHTTLYRGLKIETKNQCLQREKMQQLEKVGKFKGMEDWKKQNPDLPSIPYIPALDDSLRFSLNLLQSPPEALRQNLAKLAKGKKLRDNELFEFTQMYAKFIGAVEVMYAYIHDPQKDGLEQERANLKSRNKQITEQVQWFCNWVGTHIAQAGKSKDRKKDNHLRKNAVRILIEHVCEIIDGKKPVPQGFDKAWFENMVPMDRYKMLKKEGLEYHDPLKTTYRAGNLSNDKIRKIYEIPAFEPEELPPIK